MSSENMIDSLTQMPNRAGWLAAAESALVDGSAKAILFMDLDRFKWVNDSLGHDAGDELLRVVSQTIKNQLNSDSEQPTDNDIVGRMGGDEFVILLQNKNSIAQLEQLANQLIEKISQPIALASAEVEIGASIGVAHYPQDSHELTDLLKFADLAMYRAKHSGRNQLVVYQPEMIRQIEYRRDIQTALRQALNDGLLTLEYQAIFNCQHAQVVAVEAYLNCDELSNLSALDQAEVFAIADESQVSVQLSKWMLQSGLAYLQELDESLDDLSLVVEVRPTHFHQKGFVDWLAETLEFYEIAPERLILNLNETCLNAQRFPVQKQLQELSKLGVEVAVQSFGVGNLSPLRLHDWPVDRLHLSSLFVAEITNKRSMEAMAVALIQMGHTLNKKVVAYGVKTAEQQAMLMSQQCFLMQGPFLGETLSAQEMESLLMGDSHHDNHNDNYLDEFSDDF